MIPGDAITRTQATAKSGDISSPQIYEQSDEALAATKSTHTKQSTAYRKANATTRKKANKAKKHSRSRSARGSKVGTTSESLVFLPVPLKHAQSRMT